MKYNNTCESFKFQRKNISESYQIVYKKEVMFTYYFFKLLSSSMNFS